MRISREGEILDVLTPSDEKLFRPRKELIGKRLADVFPKKQADHFLEYIRESFATESLQSFQYYLKVPAGELHFEARVIPSDTREALVLIRDITREEEARIGRERREKLEGLTILAGGVAHDFNNLLTGILGNANLGMSKLEKDSPVRANLEQIEKCSLEAAGLCRKMLAYAGQESMELHEVDLNDVIGHLHHLLRGVVTADISLKVEPGMAVPPVIAEASQIEQVVMSLVMNAAEAIGDKDGEIRIATGVGRIGKGDLKTLAFPSALPVGNAAFFEVSDNGAGMTRETLSRAFDPFFSTKFTGRGLGLSTVQGIVNSFKGGCAITTVPGKGTTVRIYLPPAAKAKKSAAKKEVDPLKQREQGGLILVVDDEPGVCETAKEMLELLGFSVVTAGCGTAGVEEYRRRRAEISAVVLDMTMPDMRGVEALTEIRKIDSRATVLMMSGYPQATVSGEMGTDKPDGFLLKPFSLEGLAKSVRNVLVPK